jgi:hypothetical protein
MTDKETIKKLLMHDAEFNIGRVYYMMAEECGVDNSYIHRLKDVKLRKMHKHLQEAYTLLLDYLDKKYGKMACDDSYRSIYERISKSEKIK